MVVGWNLVTPTGAFTSQLYFVISVSATLYDGVSSLFKSVCCKLITVMTQL